MVHYMLGVYGTALDVLDNIAVDEIPQSRDGVELLACRANVLNMLGDTEQAETTAAAAVAAAEAIGDDRAVAAAHLAAANTSAGPRKEAHLAQALAAAERAGDVVQTARVLVNQTMGRLEAAHYPEAYEVGAKAVAAAESGGPPGMLVIALHNLGDALTRLGRYDEAAQHFKHSIALCRRLGLQRTAVGLWGLAEIHRQLGRREQSRATFEEAVTMARAAAGMQVLAPALTGLARVLLDQSGDVAAARAAADEAESLAPPEFASDALCARGWVAIAEGDPELARQRAQAAISAARASGMIDALADALELSAAAAAEPAETQAALQEALAIWESSGAAPAADRVRVLLGRLPGADGTARSTAREAEKRLVRLGVRAVHESPLTNSEGAVAVDVRLLGGFEVRVGGRVVPVPAWRSRQARTLVKILASRRGRRVTRSELCELLWPDDEVTRTAHRLSVLLSVVRSVLDPDRAWPPDHYIAADLMGLSLNLTHVSVDAEHLLQDAAHAAALLRSGDHDRAHEILTEVDARYRGDAFEDEPYEEWADGLREETRAAWLRSLRHLAELRARNGEHQDAASLLVRMLVADPYDEPAHHALVDVLVGAGRHGEARRAFDRWVGAMRSIDAPLPNPGVLRPRAAGDIELPADDRRGQRRGRSHADAALIARCQSLPSRQIGGDALLESAAHTQEERMSGRKILSVASAGLLAGAALVAVSGSPVEATVVCPTAGNLILGTTGDDVLIGTSGTDIIKGKGGRDVIKGKGGRDVLYGGPGRDTLVGGKARDCLFGGKADDKLWGDKANYVGSGGNYLDGGSGEDEGWCNDEQHSVETEKHAYIC